MACGVKDTVAKPCERLAMHILLGSTSKMSMMRATIWGGRAGTGVRVSYFAFTQGLLLFSVARAINSPSFTLCSGRVPLPAWSCPWKEQPGYSGTHLSAVTSWAWLDL